MKVRGFTLVEMVLTMVVGSTLVLGIAGFVELGSKGYADTVDRQRIQTQAKFVIEKMTREIRHAVPNSFAVNSSASQQCVSFYPIVYSGFYTLSGDDDSTLQFLIGNDNPPTSYNNLKMIINPTTQADFNNGISLEGNVYVTAHPDTGDDINNLDLLSPLTSQSVSNRQYIYNQLVSYCLDLSADSITRNNIQVADSVTSGEFSYSPPTLQRGGVVHLSLTFAQNGESSHFETDIQVLNVP